MREIGWGMHSVILVAVVINLWVGGDYIEQWFGHGWRSVFELLLILGWLTLVVGMRAPLPWRRPRPDGRDRDRPDGDGRNEDDRR
ncbi:MAG: hypothetical protein M0R73_02995 [Dehalococcoidia bacterium]|nr:hypothetical protein [Dehalococcoidia bacterium]